MRHPKFFFFSILLFVINTAVFGQYVEELSISESNANQMLEVKNYQEAVRQFEALLEEKPENLEYKFKLAKSYNYSSINKRRGLDLLKELTKQEGKPKETEYELAVAYFKNYDFASAEIVFNLLILKERDPVKKEALTKWSEQCMFSERMTNNEGLVVFENLGKTVNSDAPDFLPLIQPDEATVIFSTKRNGVSGNLFDYTGYKTSDIYISKHKNGKYSRARSIGNPNSYGNEYTAGQSEKGDYLIYTVNSEDHFNDLYVSKKGRRSFMPPEVFGSDKVNKKSAETGASLSNDGQLMYFSSDREGGLGGFDIYLVKRLPTGYWGEPKNIGTPVNTSRDEKYPLLLEEGQQLVFSSNGHPGMGELDLFEAKWDEASKNWKQIVNLGYPLNTVDDDMNISYSENKRHAYIAANREGGFGDLDIYRVTFVEAKERYTILQGKVVQADSSLIQRSLEIEVLDANNDKLVGIYKVNQLSGKYLAALSPGEYKMVIKKIDGFKELLKEVKIKGKNDFESVKKLDLILISN